MAVSGASAAWRSADLSFDRELDWQGSPKPWTLAVDGLTLEPRPTATRRLGFFPEQGRYGRWLRSALAGRTEPSVLHLFTT